MMDKERFEYIKARRQAIENKIDAFEVSVKEAKKRSEQALINADKEVLDQEDLERILPIALDALTRDNQKHFFRVMDRLVTQNLWVEYKPMKDQIIAGKLNKNLLEKLTHFNKKLSVELNVENQTRLNDK